MRDINFRRPARMSAGARVALIAPAGPVSDERIALAQACCAGLGLEAVVGARAHLRTGYLAGADRLRADDLMWAFTDRRIDAVWALRGGYGTMRLHDLLDFDVMARAGKPYVGFSDNTYLHLMLTARRTISFHGPHAGGDFPPETEAGFLRVLFAAEPAGMLPLRAQDVAPRVIAPGVAEGTLVGGNISMLAAACGTPAQLRAENCILFMEDVGEPPYRIDRCFTQLEVAGALQGLRGLACGRFSELPAGCEPGETDGLLAEIAARYQVPAVADFPIGHVEHNWTLPLGVRAVLDANACTLELADVATG